MSSRVSECIRKPNPKIMEVVKGKGGKKGRGKKRRGKKDGKGGEKKR